MAIQDLECGLTRNPGWETLARYAAALGDVVSCELRAADEPGRGHHSRVAASLLFTPGYPDRSTPRGYATARIHR
jgi:hypothetical protein